MKKPYKLNFGDKIEVLINGKTEKGFYLESHDKGVLLLKLDNGYNIGLKKEDISENVAFVRSVYYDFSRRVYPQELPLIRIFPERGSR